MKQREATRTGDRWVLTMKEAAFVTGLSERTFRSLVAAGKVLASWPTT